MSVQRKESIALKEFIRLPVPECFNFEGANYVREGRGPRIGVMVALDDKRWGWSVISPREELFETEEVPQEINVNGILKTVLRKHRKWNAEKIWERGTFIALDRAMGNIPTPEIIPSVAKRSIGRFKIRMKRYFKENN